MKVIAIAYNPYPNINAMIPFMYERKDNATLSFKTSLRYPEPSKKLNCAESGRNTATDIHNISHSDSHETNADSTMFVKKIFPNGNIIKNNNAPADIVQTKLN